LSCYLQLVSIPRKASEGRRLTNQVILVNGDIITQVGPANQIQIPAGMQVVDLSNATVIPGLIDALLHIMDSITERMPNEAVLFARAVPLALPAGWIYNAC
jgi:imidazolonepropionase-like amidohydrolase